MWCLENMVYRAVAVKEEKDGFILAHENHLWGAPIFVSGTTWSDIFHITNLVLTSLTSRECLRKMEFRKNSLVWQRRKSSKVVCQQDIIPLSCEKTLQPDRKVDRMCAGKMCRRHSMRCGINGEEIKGFQSNRAKSILWQNVSLCLVKISDPQTSTPVFLIHFTD